MTNKMTNMDKEDAREAGTCSVCEKHFVIEDLTDPGSGLVYCGDCLEEATQENTCSADLGEWAWANEE